MAGLQGKTPDGSELYNEKGDIIATKFRKDQLKTISPEMMGYGGYGSRGYRRY